MDGVEVTLGTNNMKEANRQIIYVSKRNIAVHENWNATTTVNDISIITLPAAVRFNKNIQSIRLPKKSNTYESYEGLDAFASGWGKITDSANTITDLLRFINAPIMSNSVCSRYYFGKIRSSNICIRTKKTHKSTCNGDSGGPLVVHDEQGPFQVGLTSYGSIIGCELGFPGVFTRVTSFLDWIEARTGISY